MKITQTQISNDLLYKLEKEVTCIVDLCMGIECRWFEKNAEPYDDIIEAIRCFIKDMDVPPEKMVIHPDNYEIILKHDKNKSLKRVRELSEQSMEEYPNEFDENDVFILEECFYGLENLEVVVDYIVPKEVVYFYRKSELGTVKIILDD